MAAPVVHDRVPYIPITLHIPERSATLTLQALVDTGFTNEVALPEELLPDKAPSLGDVSVRLADDSVAAVPAYLGSLRIGETTISPVTVVVLGSETMIGLEIVAQFRVTIDHDYSITFET